jgi:hypothetical protein
MQEVRADGFDRLDPLGAARADPTIAPLPLLEPELPGPRFVSLAQEVLPDGEGLRAVTHIPLPIVERVIRLQRSAEGHDRQASPHLASG